MTYFWALLIGVGVVALAAILASAQPFRAGVTLAVMDVVVTAPDGESIPDLKAADFDVKDDGVSRPVVSSVFVQIPVEMARTPSTDVWTNGQERRSRVFSFVIDDLDIPAASVGRVVAQVRRLISVIPDGDKVSLVYCGRQAGAQDFTADKARLIESLQGLSGRRPDDDEPTASAEEQHNASRVLATLKSVTETLGESDEARAAVLFLTAGFDTSVSRGLFHGSLGDDFRDLINAAGRAHVAIYPVDVRGLPAPDEADRSVDALRDLAAATGGTAILNTNTVEDAVRQVVRDSSGYYLIAYELSSNRSGHQARAHDVEVHVHRAGLIVRSRRFFVNVPHTAPPLSAAAVVNTSIMRGRILVEMQAGVTPDTVRARGRMWAIVQVKGDNIAFTQAEGRFHAALEYQIVAIDAYGGIHGRDKGRIDLNVEDRRRSQIRARGTRWISTFDLGPGRYRVRAAVMDLNTHAFGLVTGDLDVPQYAKSRGLFMSSVFLASRDASAIPTVRANVDRFLPGLNGPPTTNRRFAAHDDVDLYAEVYGAAEHSAVKIVLTVRNDAGDIVRAKAVEPFPSDKCLAGIRCLAVSVEGAMGNRDDGSYVLRVCAEQGSSSTAHDVRLFRSSPPR